MRERLIDCRTVGNDLECVCRRQALLMRRGLLAGLGCVRGNWAPNEVVFELANSRSLKLHHGSVFLKIALLAQVIARL